MGQFPIRWDETILRLVPRYCEKCEERVVGIVVLLDMAGPTVKVHCSNCQHLLIAEAPQLLAKYTKYFKLAQ